MDPQTDMDAIALAEVEQDYRDQLHGLTGNNKSQIDALSQLADDHKYAAKIIVRLIEEGVRQVKPASKLLYIYVMDSILKNVREPYVSLFAQNLPEVFKETYRAVETVNGVQRRVEKLFATWHQQKVFPPALLAQIEKDVPALRAPHLNPRFAAAAGGATHAPVSSLSRQDPRTASNEAFKVSNLHRQGSSAGGRDPRLIARDLRGGESRSLRDPRLNANSTQTLYNVPGDRADYQGDLRKRLPIQAQSQSRPASVGTYQLGQEGYSRLQGPTIDRQVHLRRGTAGSATDSHSMKNSSSHREIQRVPDLSDLPEMEMDFPGTDGARLGAQDPSHAQMQNHVQEPLPVHVGASQVPARVQVNMQRRGLVSGMAMPNTALPCSHVGLDGMNPASGLHAAIAPGGGLFGAGGGASTLTNQTQTPQLQQVVSGHPPDLLPSSMRSMPMMAGQLPFPVGPPPLPQGQEDKAAEVAKALQAAGPSAASHLLEAILATGAGVGQVLGMSVGGTPGPIPPQQVFQEPSQGVSGARRAPAQQPTTPSDREGRGVSSLLGSLLSQGVLSLRADSHNGVPEMTRDASGPRQNLSAWIGIEFKPSVLKELRTEVVDSIYGCIPKQCKACGLRIRKDKEYAAHLDWHFMRRAKQRGADVAERGWFVHKTQWLQGVGDIVTVETGTGKLGAERKTEVGEDKEDEIISVPVDDAQPECSLCSESFEVFWNAVEDDWHFRGAYQVKVNESLALGIDPGVLIHKKCRPSTDLVTKVKDGRNVFADMAAATAVTPSTKPVIGLGRDSNADDLGGLQLDLTAGSSPRKEPEMYIGAFISDDLVNENVTVTADAWGTQAPGDVKMVSRSALKPFTLDLSEKSYVPVASKHTIEPEDEVARKRTKQ